MGGDELGDGVFLFPAAVAAALPEFAFEQHLAQGRAAVVAAQDVFRTQDADVAAYGLRGNFQFSGQLFDGHKAVFAHQCGDFFVSSDLGFHGFVRRGIQTACGRCVIFKLKAV